MDHLIQKAAQDLAGTTRAVALTGAGISVESGIPPFRGKGGLWEKIDPMEFAHINAFLKDPAKVWHVLIREMKGMVDNARPNDAHKALARLEQLGILKTIITQNVDGLHQMAGNTDVIEFHGNFAWQRCMDCGGRCKTAHIDLSQIPPRCECGGIYKPDCVFFGEMIPPQLLRRSEQVALDCDIMLVVGTSALVQPAAFMPLIAKQAGAKVIEVNPERTLLSDRTSDYIIMGKAGQVMNRLTAEVERLL
ncbi:MAG: NAD-dependent deacylase [Proteobacteria bacterium]|nr:NAD-dependent deacylase [Pseudomonadota bacterium]